MLHEKVLQAMGVTILRPRFAFANAAEEDLTAHQEKAAQQESQPLQKVQDSRGALLAEIGQLDGLQTHHDSNSCSDLRFRYRLVRMDHCLMLFEQKETHWPLESQALSFFNDVYFSLFGQQVKQWQQAIFTWPPSSNYPLAKSPDQASQTLISFAAQMLNNQVQPIIMAWGSTATMLHAEELSQGTLLELPLARVLALAEVSSYWQSADQKRLLWRQLQVLYQD